MRHGEVQRFRPAYELLSNYDLKELWFILLKNVNKYFMTPVTDFEFVFNN